MAMPAMLIAWLPTYFSRYHDMDVKKAALMAGVAVLVSGVGMIFGGGLADRLSAGTRGAGRWCRPPIRC